MQKTLNEQELERKEIGDAKELEADRLYLLHIRGSPLEEALLFKALMDKYRVSQRELVKMLREMEIPYTQPQVSRLLSLLDLEPEFQKMIADKKMAHTTGFELAKLPLEYRKTLQGKERITHYDIEEIKETLIVTGDLLDLVESVPNLPIYKQDQWWSSLSPSEKEKIYKLHQKKE